MQKISIIVVDSDSKIRDYLKAILSKEGFEIQTACTGAEAIEKVNSNPHQLVITDNKLSDCSGLQVLNDIKNLSESIPVLILSSDSSLENAVDSMRRGASDYILKPFSADSILLSVKTVLDKHQNAFRESAGDFQENDQFNTKKLITNSPEMYGILEQAKNIAKSNASVLIQGESGTGKELLSAFIVHYSGRERQPYIAMNCAALPDNLAESELFGFEKGAFTGAFQKRIGKFEQAHNGTLLLDEISELSLPLQAKLLRVLQERIVDRLGGGKPVSVNTRIIATCNLNLLEAVRKGSFREDLFYRINVIPFTIPPLRRRREDIPLLVEYFINKHNQLNDKKIIGISSEALDRLCSYDWPGNVRELENVIERSVLICGQTEIMSENICLQNDMISEKQENSFSVGTTVRDMERKLIYKTLQHVDDNRTHAAQLLGISIRTLRNKLREYRGDKIDEKKC